MIDRELFAEFLRRFGGRDIPFSSLEDLLTSPDGFGLTSASDLQRAVCRVADGRPLGELALRADVRSALGDVSHLEGVRPVKIIFLAGVRTGKSLLAAANIVWSALTVDASHLGESERPRHSTISTEKDLAKVILQHLVGALQTSDVLREWLVGEPTAEGCHIQMPDGHVMEVRVVAGAKAGKSVISRWATGFNADEAPRMAGADESPINLEDTETALEGRLLDGGQIWCIGSPWAPFGPIYNQVTEWEANDRRQTKDLVVVRAQADWLNPVWWTPRRAARLREKNPTAYQTDFLARFADQEEALYTQALLALCERSGPGPVPYNPTCDYSAAIDPATRGNAWTFVIAARHQRWVADDTEEQSGRWVDAKAIVYHRQWQGSPQNPLRPRVVMREIAPILESYGLDWCYTDQWGSDFLVEIADDEGVTMLIEDWTQHNKVVAFTGVSAAMAEGEIELPGDPVFLRDFRMVKKIITRTGMSIDLPRTSDGRHCDYAPAAVRAISRWLDEQSEAVPEEGTRDRANYEARKRHERAAEELEGEESKEWWEK